MELPYTLPQDLHLFVLMQETSIDIWKKKLHWIAENGGLALIATHPDYMAFGDSEPDCDEYPVERYAAFLEHIASTLTGSLLARAATGAGPVLEASLCFRKDRPAAIAVLCRISLGD